jgi:hypothetical protein
MMRTWIRWPLGAALLVTTALGGCAKSDPPDEADAGAVDLSPPPGRADLSQALSDLAPAKALYTLNLTAPGDLTGTPRQLVVALFDSLPPAGPPSGGVLAQQNNPTVTKGQTISLSDDISTIKGDYFLLAVLYMVGGGTFSPKKGVDYTASSPSKISFTGKAIDLGTLPLALY